MVVLPEGVISSRKGTSPLRRRARRRPGAGARDHRGEELGAFAGRKAQVAWEVALGSLKYAMLARDNNKVVLFDLEEALSFDGHSAPYIQYAHARACRILEHAGKPRSRSWPAGRTRFRGVATGGARAAAGDRVVAREINAPPRSTARS